MVARRILVPPVRVRILPRQRNKGLNRNDLALYCVVHLSPMSNLVGTLSEYSIAISKNLCNFAYIGIKAF